MTTRTVQIDPLDADPEIPWTVHSGSLNVREKPSTGSRRLGSVTAGDELSGDYLIVEESDEEWLRIDFNGQPAFISRIGFSRVHPRNRELIEKHGNLPFGEEIVNRWWGIPLDYEADDLVEVPEEYRRKSGNPNYRLRQEAMESLAEMIDAMRADGLELFVTSPYRSGSRQTSIFRSRMRANLAQRRSAPPGHSEHQLGTTADLAPEATGRTLRNSDPQHAWLKENGAKYGWRQTYLAENTEETGYIEEPWHWRYMGREKLAQTEPLTLRPVEIDPLGADPETPWTINIGSLNVRDNPSTADSSRLGSVRRGDTVSGGYLIVEESDEEWLQIDFNGQPAFISRMGFSRVHPRNRELIEEHGNLPFGEEIVNRWWGIPLNYEADDLVEIPEEYRRRSETRDYRLRREAMETLAEMIDAMRADGLEMFVSSPYRSGSLQTSMFHRRMRNNLAQRGTAPPGHSEHQLGTTVDLAPELTGRTLRNSDPQHAWLKKNGAQYGWRQTYLADNTEETGYIEEPWHWRYVGPEKLAAAGREDVILEILNPEGQVEAALNMEGTEAAKDFDAFIEYTDIGSAQYPLSNDTVASAPANRTGVGTAVSIADFVSDGKAASFSLTVRKHRFERFETVRTPSGLLRFPIFRKYQFEGEISLNRNETVTFGKMPDRSAWSVRIKQSEADTAAGA